ncbi:MAG TPA: hypothetical protein DCP25_17375 [Chloroflexi bacterium]|nr:hypothetical protein [Chloroflexota bacterium]
MRSTTWIKQHQFAVNYVVGWAVHDCLHPVAHPTRDIKILCTGSRLVELGRRSPTVQVVVMLVFAKSIEVA